MLTEISDDVRNRPFGQYQVAATSDHDEACAALESVFQPRRLRLEKTARPARALDLVLNTFPVGEVTVNYLSFGCDVRISFEPENFRGLLKLMQDSTAAGGLIARAANRHLSKADREAAGVLSSAQRHTHFLDSPRMAAVMARSDFRFAQLKDRTASVFLVLPLDRLGTYSRWPRLMVAQAITDMARSPVQTPAPVLRAIRF